MQITRSGTSITSVCFPNGNIGIGTTAPSYTLDVLGTIHYSGSNCCNQFTTVAIHTATFSTFNVPSTLGDGIYTVSVLSGIYYGLATVVVYSSAVTLINTTLNSGMSFNIVSGNFAIFNKGYIYKIFPKN